MSTVPSIPAPAFLGGVAPTAQRPQRAPRTRRPARIEDRGVGPVNGTAAPAVPALPPSLADSQVLPAKPEPAAPLEALQEAPTPEIPLDDAALAQAVMLNWLGQQPVSFHRMYVDITGGVLNALWLSHVLSRLHAQLQQTQAPAALDAAGDYEFPLDVTLCEAQTGLSKLEQKRCMGALDALGLLVPDRQRSPRTGRLRLQRLAELMVQHSEALGVAVQASAEADPMNLEVLEARSRVRRAKHRGTAA